MVNIFPMFIWFLLKAPIGFRLWRYSKEEAAKGRVILSQTISNIKFLDCN